MGWQSKNVVYYAGMEYHQSSQFTAKSTQIDKKVMNRFILSSSSGG